MYNRKKIFFALIIILIIFTILQLTHGAIVTNRNATTKRPNTGYTWGWRIALDGF